MFLSKWCTPPLEFTSLEWQSLFTTGTLWSHPHSHRYRAMLCCFCYYFFFFHRQWVLSIYTFCFFLLLLDDVISRRRYWRHQVPASSCHFLCSNCPYQAQLQCNSRSCRNPPNVTNLTHFFFFCMCVLYCMLITPAPESICVCLYNQTTFVCVYVGLLK